MKILNITIENGINYLNLGNANHSETRLLLTDNQLRELLNANKYEEGGNSRYIIYTFKN